MPQVERYSEEESQEHNYAPPVDKSMFGNMNFKNLHVYSESH
jgi:hypothetical protein